MSVERLKWPGPAPAKTNLHLCRPGPQRRPHLLYSDFSNMRSHYPPMETDSRSAADFCRNRWSLAPADGKVNSRMRVFINGVCGFLGGGVFYVWLEIYFNRGDYKK